MNYFSIGSGSSGNCAYIGTESTKLLLDSGISGKRTAMALSAYGINPESIDAILITHEHRDHVSCLGVLARKYHIPIYATELTVIKIKEDTNLGVIDDNLFNIIGNEERFLIGDIEINAIPISHDAVDPVAYVFQSDEKRLAIITDLGCYDDVLIDKLKNLNAIVIESNHDLRMLETGVYPYKLKRRISGPTGHISNEDCGKLLSEILHDNLRWIVLAHLSAENNFDKLAIESVGLEITMSECRFSANDFPIYIAPRCDAGKILNIY